VDLSKLSTGDKVIGIGAIVYLIAMFLPWEGIDLLGSSFSNSGWSYFLGGIIPLLLIAAVTARVALTRYSPETKLPDLPIPWGQATLYGAIAAAAIVVLRLLIPASEGSGLLNVDLDRKYGLFVATLAAIAVAGGAFMKYQAKEDEEGGTTGGTSAPPTSF